MSRSPSYGDGQQSRSFAHVADVVGALIALMANPKARGEVFNVGNDEEVTIRSVSLAGEGIDRREEPDPDGPLQ